MSSLPQQPMVTARRHMVVAGHYLAAEAGLKMLEAGGNAIDAGVAAGIALAVVHSDQVQFSGVAPMLIYLAEQDEVVSIAGLGYWPKATSLGMFRDQHGGSIPLGLLRTVVPAGPDASGDGKIHRPLSGKLPPLVEQRGDLVAGWSAAGGG